MSTVQATNLKHGSSATNNVVLDASGNTTISGTLSVSGVTGNVYPLVQGTAVASTSGVAVDFTGIPSWARRVTVMFRGVSISGTANYLVQVGTSSGVVTTGYLANAMAARSTSTALGVASTAGFIATADNGSAAYLYSGSVVLTNISGNVWVSSGILAESTAVRSSVSSGDVALAGVLDRVRITTVGGTDTFDAGSINILFE